MTSITLGTSTTNLAYDNDGNLLTTGNATNTWNYKNQLTQSITGNGSSTYAYDYLGARVSLRENATTTIFPTPSYNVAFGSSTSTASTTVKSILANGLLIATVQGATGTIYYDLTDHLGGLNLVEATSGAGMETLDYYPYGGIRVDNKASSYGGSKRKYIGQLYDAGTGLNYLNARYQNPAQGQFLSEDPVFLGVPNQQTISDPQSLNAYSYSEDNPITKSDPNGRAGFALDDPFSQILSLGAFTVPWATLGTGAAVFGGAAAIGGAAYLAAYSPFENVTTIPIGPYPGLQNVVGTPNTPYLLTNPIPINGDMPPTPPNNKAPEWLKQQARL